MTRHFLPWASKGEFPGFNPTKTGRAKKGLSPEVLAVAREVLKDEIEVFEYAQRVHEAQLAYVRSQQPSVPDSD